MFHRSSEFIRGLWHGVTHRHKVLSRGFEELVICVQRWPRRGATVLYRPHGYAQWARMSIDEFRNRIDKEAPEWTLTKHP